MDDVSQAEQELRAEVREDLSQFLDRNLHISGHVVAFIARRMPLESPKELIDEPGGIYPVPGSGVVELPDETRGSGVGQSRQPGGGAVIAHQPWCTDHITEDPPDVLTECANECVAVFDVLPAGGGRGPLDVTVSMMPDGSGPVLSIEDYRLLTVEEAELLYAVLGRALEAVRR